MSQGSSRFRYVINLTPNYTKFEENPKRPVNPTTVGSCSPFSLRREELEPAMNPPRVNVTLRGDA